MMKWTKVKTTNFFEEKKGDLRRDVNEKRKLPTLMQYGVKLPFRVAAVRQTDSGKTHSIIRRWLGGKISFWKHDVNGELKACQLQHCLYCSNGGISDDEKKRLKEEFIDEDREQPQRLFHLN